MNRAQRRKLAKKGLDHKDLKILHDYTVHDSIKQAVKYYSVVTAMVLHDKWGFGNVRLKRYLEQVQELFDAIEKGYVSLDDCEKILLEECDVEIE